MQVIPAITPLNGSLAEADARRLSPYLCASITPRKGGYGRCWEGVTVTVAEPAAGEKAEVVECIQGLDSSIKSHPRRRTLKKKKESAHV